MSTDQIPPLMEALQRGNMALFVGGDLPREATGLPGRADLARELASRLGLGGPTPPWPEVAAQYEAQAGLNALIRWVQGQYDAGAEDILDALLARLPVSIYITTRYDGRLYDALRDAGRRPNLPVIDAPTLNLVDPGHPLVVKLFGTLDRPDSLVFTAAQLRRLVEDKRHILNGLVHPTLANRSVLVLGQDLRDRYFEAMYVAATLQSGSLRPPAYAAWPGLAGWEKETWRRQEVWVVEVEALDLARRLVSQVEGVEPTSGAARQIGPGDLVEAAPDQGFQEKKGDNLPGDPALPAVRDLLLAAFSAATLPRLFLFSSRPELRPIVQEFSPNDGLAAMVAKAIAYCVQHRLLSVLLHEVKEANPGQYEHFFSQLWPPAR